MSYIPIKKLSASRIKTFTSCSQIYFAKYVLKAPDESNAGAAKGYCVHALLEVLLNKNKYYDYVNNIVKTKIIPKACMRFLARQLKKTNFYSEENLFLCEKYLLVALSNDFWLEGMELEKAEIEFTITKEYKIGGFIDVRGIKVIDGKKICKIRDYKSSKNKFTDKELETNVQAFSYLLAALQDHPDLDILNSEVEFVFLQFPEDPIQVFKLKDDKSITGFEQYLRYIQKQIDLFTEKDATNNLAASLGWPEKGEGFCKLTMCGRAKSPGDLKKDGTPMYYCKFKFPFSYYAALDNDGNVVYTSFDPIKDSRYKTEKLEYAGCPYFNRKKVTYNNNDCPDDFDF